MCCSSLGQNLSTSTFVGEITFAIIIATVGLVLFALLIGNMQVSPFKFQHKLGNAMQCQIQETLNHTFECADLSSIDDRPIGRMANQKNRYRAVDASQAITAGAKRIGEKI